jgi:hypothetical protein
MTQPEWTTPPATSPSAPAYGPASTSGASAPTPAAAAAAPTPAAAAFAPDPVPAPGPLLVPAPIFSRFVAFVVDFGGTVALTSVVVLACVSGGLNSFFDNGSGTGGGSAASSALVLLGFVALFLIPIGSIILNVTLTRVRRHSVGQALMRIRLVDARTGGAASVGSIIARMLLLVIPGIATVMVVAVAVRVIADGFSVPGPSIVTIFAPVILALTIVSMVRGDRRGWHDRATNQRVVAAAPRG